MRNGGFYFLLVGLVCAVIFYAYDHGGFSNIFKFQTPNSTTRTLNNGSEKIEVLQVGSGRIVHNGSVATIQYTAHLENGREFDATDPDKPLAVTLGTGDVMRGLEEGLKGMQVGEKRRLTIAPDWAFGPGGDVSLGVPGNTVVIYEITLLSVQ